MMAAAEKSWILRKPNWTKTKWDLRDVGKGKQSSKDNKKYQIPPSGTIIRFWIKTDGLLRMRIKYNIVKKPKARNGTICAWIQGQIPFRVFTARHWDNDNLESKTCYRYSARKEQTFRLLLYFFISSWYNLKKWSMQYDHERIEGYL